MATTFGYTIFYVSDVGATLRFFTEAFGLSQRFVTPENDYGELETGTTTLAFASIALAETGLKPAGGFTPISPDVAPVGASITLITTDVAETLEAAVVAGGCRYVDPVDKPWGQTVAYLRDPNGILIEVATAVESPSDDEGVEESSQIDSICSWCAEMPAASLDNVFGPQTNVYRVGEKIFAMVNVEDGDMVTVKALPDDGEALRSQYSAVRPGYYMNKRHWITIDLVGEVPMAEVHELIEESHRLVFGSLSKKQQAAIH